MEFISDLAKVYSELAAEEDTSSIDGESPDSPFGPRSVNIYAKSQVVNLLCNNRCNDDG